MPEKSDQDRSAVFDPVVARSVQDLLDARIAPRRFTSKTVPGPVGAVVGWTAGTQTCLRLISDLIDDVELSDEESPARRDALRQALDSMREALGGVLDGQAAAIWFSLPFAERVARIRRLAKRADVVRHRAETAESERARTAALRQWRTYAGALEDRARLDPVAADEAGYDLVHVLSYRP